jgi:hypothetical protein
MGRDRFYVLLCFHHDKGRNIFGNYWLQRELAQSLTFEVERVALVLVSKQNLR